MNQYNWAFKLGLSKSVKCQIYYSVILTCNKERPYATYK